MYVEYIDLKKKKKKEKGITLLWAFYREKAKHRF